MSEDKIDIKIVVVGSYSIGKTALIDRYFTDAFSQEYNPTIQFDMKSRTLVNSFGKEVTLNVWDTCGQEKFGSIVPMFYSNSHIAFICFDFTDKISKDKINGFIESVHERCSSCIFYLVATRLDTYENNTEIHDFLSYKVDEISNKYSDLKISSFITSAKTGEGINILFERAADEDINSKSVVQINIDEINDKEKKCC